MDDEKEPKTNDRPKVNHSVWKERQASAESGAQHERMEELAKEIASMRVKGLLALKVVDASTASEETLKELGVEREQVLGAAQMVEIAIAIEDIHMLPLLYAIDLARAQLMERLTDMIKNGDTGFLPDDAEIPERMLDDLAEAIADHEMRKAAAEASPGTEEPQPEPEVEPEAKAHRAVYDSSEI